MVVARLFRGSWVICWLSFESLIAAFSVLITATVSANLHSLRLALDAKSDIDSKRLPRREFRGWNLEVGKAFGFGRQGVVARLEIYEFK